MKIKTTSIQIIALIAMTIIFALGCERNTGPEEAGAQTEQQQETLNQQDETTQEQDYDMMQEMPEEENDTQQKGNNQSSNEDVKHAEELWTQIKDYENWTVPQGFEGWQDGVSPHGKYLHYYINDVAAEDLAQDGAIIVKENFTSKNEDSLESITIMEKREGYDPETGNWFYVKYSPDGKIMTNPQGMKIAGLVGKGKEQGCIPCHATADGDDYLFMNDNNSIDPNSQ